MQQRRRRRGASLEPARRGGRREGGDRTGGRVSGSGLGGELVAAALRRARERDDRVGPAATQRNRSVAKKGRAPLGNAQLGRSAMPLWAAAVGGRLGRAGGPRLFPRRLRGLLSAPRAAGDVSGGRRRARAVRVITLHVGGDAAWADRAAARRLRGLGDQQPEARGVLSCHPKQRSVTKSFTENALTRSIPTLIYITQRAARLASRQRLVLCT